MRNLYLLLALFFVSLLQAQNPAAIDLGFDYLSNKPFLNGQVNESYIQSDGKIILWGDFTEFRLGKTGETVKANHIIRLNDDLTLDTTFKFGEKLVGTINGVGLQSTGKIVISVGEYTATYNGTPLSRMFRLNPDGTLDPTFLNNSYSYAFVLNDDKILYRGNVGMYRLNSNGGPDNVPYGPTGEFLGSGANSGYFRRFPDGTVVDAYSSSLYKVNADGTTDMNFWTNESGFNCSFGAFDMQPDGKILVGGFFNSYSKNTHNPDTHTEIPAWQLVRLNANNTLDTSFNSQGFEISATVSADCQTYGVTMICLQTDGKILVAGRFPSYGATLTQKLIRLNADGSIDPTFNIITNFNYNICHLKVLPDGKIFVGTTKLTNDIGTYPTYQNFEVANFFALDHNGNLLYTDKSSNLKINNIVKNGANNFLLLGESRLPYHRGVKQINSIDGGLEPNANLLDAFDANTFFGVDNAVSVLAGTVQPDGKILLGGTFTKYNGISVTKLVRLNSDFTIDTSFNLGSGFSRTTQPEIANITNITLQPDGKIIVSGDFNIFNGQSFPRGTIRLNANGSLDTTFNYTGSHQLNKIIPLANGQILGYDTSIKRYNTDGTLDPTFTAIQNYGDAFGLQSNGKIVTGYGRYNTDGSVDSSYLGTGLSSAPVLTVQADDKVLIGYYGVERLNADGSVDEAFDSGTGCNGQIHSIVIDDNGRILVAGDFTRYNGAWCTGIVRLIGGDAYVIRGKNKFDSDNNGCDDSDIIFPNMKLNITNGLNSMDIIPNTTGDYAVTVGPGTYTVTPSLPAGAFAVSPTSFTVTFPSAASTAIQDFCLTSNGIHPDLEVKIIPMTVPRPGFVTKYKIIYKNKGNQLQSGTVNLNFNDAVMDFYSAVPSITSQSLNNFNWNFTNLYPLEQREIILQLKLNSPQSTPPLNAGSLLNYTTMITAALTDDTPNDNTFTLHQTVVNAFDPNDKTCLEGATISNTQVGDYVHYMIRFENKGTYNAQNISVKDVIDTAKFDISTLTPLSGSHLYVTRITEGNKVEFYFADINLPIDDANNDGYVVFKIKTKSTLVSGDTFSNSAAIYFDYNSAINTNTATTTIQALAVKDFAFDQYFTVYPNPANDHLNIEKKENIEISSLSVFNTLGQLIMTIPNAQKISTIDVSSLRSGNYFLRINSDKGISNTKFIKL